MNNIDKQQNKRIFLLALAVMIIATFAMIMQFKILLDIGAASTSQVIVVSATAVMQMAALLVITLQKVGVRLEEVHNLAYADELTGLINRRKFNEILERTLHKSRKQKKKIGILILDLDKFKHINDCYGHDAGDKVICQFGERIQKAADSSSIICRMSGDEFAMLIKDVGGQKQVMKICQTVLKEMKKPFIYEGKKILASVSIGAALVDGFEDEELTALRMADYALLNSKENGRNQVMFFSSKMANKIKRRKHLEASLCDAISNEVLSLNYQPFVLQESSTISGVEALIRWEDPLEGQILPSEFLPVAQELALIDEIGEYILERACREIKPLKDLRLAVNINPAQFTHEGFVKQLKRVLKKTGFEPSRLELELGQNLLISSSKKIKSDLEEIRALGVKIVLDDFGSSYSNMFFLRDFKLDRVKLDRNFVSNMRNEKDGDETIDNMIGLGSTFSNKLTVEGIETQEHLNSLQQNDSNDLQGFLFSKPLTISQLEESQIITDFKQRYANKDKLFQTNSSPINRMAG